MLNELSIVKPIFQAPMAGITTPSFVATCSETGILGWIGAGYLNGQQTQAFIREVKQLTTKPFGINVYIQEEPKIDVIVLQQARMALEPIYKELQIRGVPKVISTEVYQGQIEAIAAEKVPYVSFTFGIPTDETMQLLREAGCTLIGTATTLKEAVAIEQAGMDAVILQGAEAGGHRGYFLEPMELVPLRTLIEQVKGQVSIPIIAAGGIMTKAHVDEILALGADYVQMGSIFIPAIECEADPLQKEAVLSSNEQATVISSAYTGKPARTLKNRFTQKMEHEVIAPYPLQFHLTKSITKVSKKESNKEYLSVWLGQNGHLAQVKSVRDIVDSL